MRQTLVLSALLCLGLPAGIASAACEGRYEGLVTVKSAQGMSVAPLQWTVRDGKLFGGFEGPAGLYMVEATVDAKCKIVLGYANDYDVSAPMLVEGTVTEGTLKHNGPVTVTYKVELLPPQ
jgi:hypothetical protein